MFRIDPHRGAPVLLHVRHDLQREGSFSATRWTEDFGNAAARQPARTQRSVERSKTGWEPYRSLMVAARCENVGAATLRKRSINVKTRHCLSAARELVWARSLPVAVPRRPAR